MSYIQLRFLKGITNEEIYRDRTTAENLSSEPSEFLQDNDYLREPFDDFYDRLYSNNRMESAVSYDLMKMYFEDSPGEMFDYISATRQADLISEIDDLTESVMDDIEKEEIDGEKINSIERDILNIIDIEDELGYIDRESFLEDISVEYRQHNPRRHR